MESEDAPEVSETQPGDEEPEVKVENEPESAAENVAENGQENDAVEPAVEEGGGEEQQEIKVEEPPATAPEESEAPAAAETDVGPGTETETEPKAETDVESSDVNEVEAIADNGAVEPLPDIIGDNVNETAAVEDPVVVAAEEGSHHEGEQDEQEKGSIVDTVQDAELMSLEDVDMNGETDVAETKEPSDTDALADTEQAVADDEEMEPEVGPIEGFSEAGADEFETQSDKKPQVEEPSDVPQNLYQVFHKDDINLTDGSDKKKPKPDEKQPSTGKKWKKTYPHIARVKKESVVLDAIKKPAPPHEYFGLIFSAESKRPPGYYHNYFLPIQKQPLYHQHLKIVGKTIPTEAVKPFLKAPLHSMPLSTIKVRWTLHRRSTVYKASDLFAYLTKYGNIERVYQLTNNSALVVFEDLESALAAVKDPGLGYPWDTLIADWLEPRMNNRSYLKKYRNIEESPFTAALYNHYTQFNKYRMASSFRKP